MGFSYAWALKMLALSCGEVEPLLKLAQGVDPETCQAIWEQG